MEEAAAKLNSTPEYLNDQVLSALARLSHVADDAAKVIRYKSEESFPAISHIKPLVLALEKVRSSLPSQLLSNSE
jgi:hypothetical protein